MPLLPLISFTLIFLVLHKKALDWRVSFLAAAIIWGGLVAVSTEALSIAHALTRPALTAFWGSCGIIGGVLAGRRSSWKNRPFSFPSLTIYESLVLIALGILLTLTLVTAVTAPPNNWDSMTYHMSRVMHWQQNHTVHHYATPIIRQLTFPPWSEWAILHFQVLSKNDHWANLIQWFSMVGSLIGVSLLVQLFGASRRIQFFSALLTACLPMGLLQASSTQNDYVSAFWIISFIAFLYLTLRNPSAKNTVLCGLGLGLALLTKGTAYIYVLPFLLYFFLAGLRRHKKNFWIPALTIPVLALMLNAGYFIRNVSLIGNILPGAETSPVRVTRPGPEALVSNLSRNLASQLSTPFPPINALIVRGVQALHQKSRLDIDDPATTFSDSFSLKNHPFHEDHAGNTIHTLLILLAFPILLICRNKIPKGILIHTLNVTGALLLANLLLKWQPWGSRLFLPLATLYSPVIAIALTTINKRLMYPLSGIIVLLALPWALGNASRPLLGPNSVFQTPRVNQYFTNRPDFQLPYLETTHYLRQASCADIGLLVGADAWEYPFWVMIRPGNANVTLRHLRAGNASKKYPVPANFHPCALISLRKPFPHRLTWRQQKFIHVRQFGFVGVFRPDPTGKLAYQNLREHLTNTLRYGRIADLTPGREVTALIQWRKKELLEARLVDTDLLNRVAPPLGKSFKNILVKGLQWRMAGYARQDKRLYFMGQKLVQIWKKRFEQALQGVITRLP